MNASEFAKLYHADADWIVAMGANQITPLEPGQRGTYSGFPATVLRHYHNGMYEISVPGGVICVSFDDFIPQVTP